MPDVVKQPADGQEFKLLSEALSAADREGGYPAARRVFDEQAPKLRPALHWRAHLELAECAKRGASLVQVSYHLSKTLQAQPHTVQVWLEACRTFDELGELKACRQLLEKGLHLCAPSELLALKLVRVLERLGDSTALRSLLGSLRREVPERASKVLLEGAHFEVRAGRGDAVRSLMRCMLLRLPHQGPIYCEACRVESVLGYWRQALSIAESGVQASLRYGPLWFLLVRLVEKAYGARAVKDYASIALQHVCHELHWKFHFEVAAAYGREANIFACRRSIGAAALNCPRHLRWKVWLLASRSELWDGSLEASRMLLARSQVDAPARMQAAVCIERARMEEFVGEAEAARAALAEAHRSEGHDWKVYLEHIFMEARQGCLDAAHKTAVMALDVHLATGRLWSGLIALEHSRDGASAAMSTFRRAVREVPKSGEVWCEGARVYMNPLGKHFSLHRAHKCLNFAVYLTPQYGDSFLELLRLRYLLEISARIRSDQLTIGLLGAPDGQLGNSAEGATDAAVPLPDERQRMAIAALVAQRVCVAVGAELKAGRFGFSPGMVGDSEDAVEDASDGAPRLRLSQLDMLCTYADPNYGFLWFWCRQTALTSPREVLQRMREVVSKDLAGSALWTYVWAIACEIFSLRDDAEGPRGSSNGLWGADRVDGAAASSAVGSGPRYHDTTMDSSVQKDGNTTLSEGSFAIGSIRLARCFAHGTANLMNVERQRLIFGSDILCV
mmetsp:Transcript_61677/g.133606  ORF Transcript_61677/g.133606 Transcript_61677/m.133606 type:complete len:731 (-) Transcript_61677:204-2396(-)|eukprot:CAMPEP_0170623994 /NCGR_PEP_ID=MMETSP0224-20130122/29993_1 /TAXON_ID=285029 /ORGANISM="Togula jolla, Strain CCCM 725" /LENGTH=730 /DNA_ID=CAMNT_0010950481 /DNA_START=66 /DNA_END=2258 /DNA_ORIENTATION=-